MRSLPGSCSRKYRSTQRPVTGHFLLSSVGDQSVMRRVRDVL